MASFQFRDRNGPRKALYVWSLAQSNKVAPDYPRLADGEFIFVISVTRPAKAFQPLHWFNLSDPTAEEALYDSRSLRQFVGIDSANVHDSQVLPDLLHGEETRVWGDSAYGGQTQAIADHAPRATDFTQAKGSRNRELTDEERSRNRNKSRVRAKVEHQLGIIKRQFGFSKVRYRGLDENAHRLFVACPLNNLVVVKRTLSRRTRPEMQASCA
jgi:IS5 family transposase